MTIRPGQPEDAAALAALFSDFYAEADRAAPTMTATMIVRDGLTADRKFSILVAEADRPRPIGFAFWCPTYDTDLVGPGGHLLDLYVTPNHRRRGHGRALIAACARAVRAAGGRFLTWDTDLENTAARALYTPLGRTTDPLVTFVADGQALDDLADSD